MEVVTPRADELEEMLELEKRLTDRELDLDEFKELFEDHPELFVVCREEGRIIGEASGELKDGKILLESIAVREGFRGEGLGRDRRYNKRGRRCLGETEPEAGREEL
jgi:N-acetylglutamate synthase-like GNAT family acetyltransferase